MEAADLPMEAAPAPGALVMSAPDVVSFGDFVRIRVTGARKNANVILYAGTGFGEGPCVPSNADCVDINGPYTSYTVKANKNGVATFAAPASIAGDVFFQAYSGGTLTNVERMFVGDQDTGRVRIVHASPDAPAVDIYANGGLLVPGLDYLASTGFLTIPAGTYDIDIRAAGASSSSTPAFSVPGLVVSEYDQLTVVAAGLLGSADPNDAFRVLPIAESWASPQENTFLARIVHASPDAPTVDIDVLNDGSSEIPVFARFADTGAGGVLLPSDTVLPIGIAGGAVDVTIPPLPAGANVLVLAAGLLGAAKPSEPDAFGLLAIIEDGDPILLRQDPQVYALHASPDAPAVDIKVGGATVVNDLSFRQLAGPLSVPPASYDLDIYDATGTAYVTTYTTPELEAGQRYLAIATGLLTPPMGQPAFTIIPVVDDIEVSDGVGLIAVHGSPDAPTVQAGAIIGSFTSLTGSISFGDVAGPVYVPGGIYDLAVADTAGTPLLGFPGVSLPGGTRAIVVASGLLGDSSFGLTVVDTASTPWTAATLLPAL